MRTILRGLAAATALSLAPLTAVALTAAPAQALAEVPTTAAFNPGLDTRGIHGELLQLTGTVTTADGSNPEGPVYLQRLAPGGSWKTVDTDTSAGSAFFFEHDEFVGNAGYRILYPGATDTSGETTWLGSVSPTLSVKTGREIDWTDASTSRSVRVRAVVKPKFGGKRITVQVKRAGKFRTIRKVRTNKRGVAFISVAGSRRGIVYQLVAPGDRNYVASATRFEATRF